MKIVCVGDCETCRHWLHDPDAYSSPPPEGWGYCARALNTNPDEPDPMSLAFAQDAEGYYAALYTAPDFGCVQWEAKE